MWPFDQYPKDERELFAKLPKGNCRHGYGLYIQRHTGITRCAYCRCDLTGDYYRWLLLTRDHVIPLSVATKLGIPHELAESLANQVLCCSGCNGFANRWGGKGLPPEFKDVTRRDDWTKEEFLQLRNRVFEDRCRRIAKRRGEEIAFFERKPWKQAATPKTEGNSD